MKKLIVIIGILAISATLYAVEVEQYSVSMPDGSVRIVHYIPCARSLESILKEQGLFGYPIFKLNPADVVPAREDRPFWKAQNGKIVVDSVKKQAHLDEIAAKQAKKDAVLAKLKITADEWKDINDKKVNPTSVSQ